MTSDELAALARRLFESYGEGDLDSFRADADRISRLWMVDALPAYSDEFWS
jgi:hypothetical protein